MLLFQVNCLDSVSNLAMLVYHYKYRTLKQRKVEHSMSDMLNLAYQEILSCQVDGGGFSVYYGGRYNNKSLN